MSAANCRSTDRFILPAAVKSSYLLQSPFQRRSIGQDKSIWWISTDWEASFLLGFVHPKCISLLIFLSYPFKGIHVACILGERLIR
jgi:hypothetical protein